MYHFCSRHCVAKFEADPAGYAGPGDPDRRTPARRRGDAPAPPTVADDGGREVHPHDAPGRRAGRPRHLPEVRMALEPVTPQAGADDDSELRDMRRRFALAAARTLPVFALAMVPMSPGVGFPTG